MKKIILLFLFLLQPLNIKAVTLKYRYYKEEKIYSQDYYIEGENSLDFPYKSDIFITESSPWLNERPIMISNRVIKTNQIEINNQKIRYFYFSNIDTGGNLFKIANLKVYQNGIVLPISITSNTSLGNSYSNIPGENENDPNRILFQNNLQYMLIDLGAVYDYRNIDLELFFQKVDDRQYSFDILVNEEGENGHHFYTKTFNETLNGSKSILLNLHYHFQNNLYYEEYYQFIDTKYKYYKIVKEYLDGYYSEQVPGYIKDQFNYIEDYSVNFKNDSIEDFSFDNNETGKNQYIIENKLANMNDNPSLLSKSETLKSNQNEIIIKAKPIKIKKEIKDKNNFKKNIIRGTILILISLIYFFIKIVERKNYKVLSNWYKNK